MKTNRLVNLTTDEQHTGCQTMVGYECLAIGIGGHLCMNQNASQRCSDDI